MPNNVKVNEVVLPEQKGKRIESMLHCSSSFLNNKIRTIQFYDE